MSSEAAVAAAAFAVDAASVAGLAAAAFEHAALPHCQDSPLSGQKEGLERLVLQHWSSVLSLWLQG